MAEADDLDELAREALRLYLTRQISRSEAEARLGGQLPPLGDWKPLGEPDAQAGWEMLLDACVSDEERQTIQRAQAEADSGRTFGSEAAQTIVVVLDRVKRRKP